MTRQAGAHAATARPAAASAFVVAALAVAWYLPSLNNGFSLDDYNWLERVQFAKSYWSFALAPEPGEIMCPVSKAFLLLLHAIAGLQPLWYRIPILALHALNTVLVYALVARIAADAQLAFVSACLFACSSVSAEAIFWIAAFFHPFSAALYLGALLCFVRWLQTAARADYCAALALFTLGLFSKASSYTLALLLPVAAVIIAARERSRREWLWRAAPFAAVFTAAVLFNLLVVVPGSYLIGRGYYAFGWHITVNLLEYLARLAFPFSALCHRIGFDSFDAATRHALMLAMPPLLVGATYCAPRAVRFFIAFLLVALLPFLPFTFDPTSRYMYLASCGWAVVVGFYLLRLSRLTAINRPAMAAVTLVLILAPHVAEMSLRDRDYEQRERFMSQLVADVRNACPSLPDSKSLTVLDFPLLAIDRGIHFEAALRLAYDEPALQLYVLDSDAYQPDETAGTVLVFKDGRISSPR